MHLTGNLMSFNFSYYHFNATSRSRGGTNKNKRLAIFRLFIGNGPTFHRHHFSGKEFIVQT